MDSIKNDILKRIENSRGKRFLTNCYSMDVVEHCRRLWTSADQFLFSYEDHGIQRLVFFVESWHELNKLLDTVDDKGKYYLEFLTKNPSDYEPLGSVLIARMMRISNADCRSVLESDSKVIHYKDAVEVESACIDDVEMINSILWNTFRTEIGHLLFDDELRRVIKEGKITVHRNSSDIIDALLQADVLPKKFYINQIVNLTERKVIHAILLDRLEKYIKMGGRYLYAWVQDTNIASIKFHEKYGMKHDGMWDILYCLER